MSRTDVNDSVWKYNEITGDFDRTNSYINLPAVIIVAIVTIILVKGIQESAGFNALMVFIKLAAVLFVILVGCFYINPDNWHPFAPFGWTGISFFGIPVAGDTFPKRQATRRAWREPRSFSSPISASIRFPRMPRKPKTLSGTYPSASSPRCSFAPFFTSPWSPC